MSRDMDSIRPPDQRYTETLLDDGYLSWKEIEQQRKILMEQQQQKREERMMILKRLLAVQTPTLLTAELLARIQRYIIQGKRQRISKKLRVMYQQEVGPLRDMTVWDDLFL